MNKYAAVPVDDLQRVRRSLAIPALASPEDKAAWKHSIAAIDAAINSAVEPEDSPCQLCVSPTNNCPFCDSFDLMILPALIPCPTEEQDND